MSAYSLGSAEAFELMTHVYVEPWPRLVPAPVLEVVAYHGTPVDGHFAEVVIGTGSGLQTVYRHVSELVLPSPVGVAGLGTPTRKEQS